MSMKNPTVTIKDKAQSREITTKNGKKTVWYQPVTVECEQFRVIVDCDLDDERAQYPVGAKFEWDVVADLVPGAYASIDLARRMTLVALDSKPATKVA